MTQMTGSFPRKWLSWYVLERSAIVTCVLTQIYVIRLMDMTMTVDNLTGGLVSTTLQVMPGDRGPSSICSHTYLSN